MPAVEATEHPGGPDALLIRFTRAERRFLLQRLTVTVVPVAILFGVLATVSTFLNTQPNVWGLVAALSICLGLLTLAFPPIYVLNLRMSTYYLDERWLALYLGIRRRSIDLNSVVRVTAGRWTHTWRFRSRNRMFVLPSSVGQSDAVLIILSKALARSVSAKGVLKIDPEVAGALGRVTPEDAEVLPRTPAPELSRPPVRVWPDVRVSRHW
jgi:hypothetical protein